MCQIFGEKEGADASVALVEMKKGEEGILHYHDNITEIYVFSSGEGSIKIGTQEIDIQNDDIYVIKPNNSHFIKAKTDMKFMCICTPPWTEKHEIQNIIKETDEIEKSKKDGLIFSNLNKKVKVFYKNIIKLESKKQINERTVFYFQKGNGTIKIEEKESRIHEGEAFVVERDKQVIITPENELTYIIVEN